MASASACHKLWYLHLCADAGIVVTAYVDEAEGTMNGDRFERIVLRPRVSVTAGDRELALSLHHKAHQECYIANSLNFPVDCEPSIE